MSAGKDFSVPNPTQTRMLLLRYHKETAGKPVESKWNHTDSDPACGGHLARSEVSNGPAEGSSITSAWGGTTGGTEHTHTPCQANDSSYLTHVF